MEIHPVIRHPPEYFFPIRGVLSAQAGIHPLPANVPLGCQLPADPISASAIWQEEHLERVQDDRQIISEQRPRANVGQIHRELVLGRRRVSP